MYCTKWGSTQSRLPTTHLSLFFWYYNNLNHETLGNLSVLDGSLVIENLATANQSDPALAQVVSLSDALLHVRDPLQRVHRNFLVDTSIVNSEAHLEGHVGGHGDRAGGLRARVRARLRLGRQDVGGTGQDVGRENVATTQLVVAIR